MDESEITLDELRALVEHEKKITEAKLLEVLKEFHERTGRHIVEITPVFTTDIRDVKRNLVKITTGIESIYFP